MNRPTGSKNGSASKSALPLAEKKLQAAYEQALTDLGAEQAAIFGAHLTILGDPELLGGVKTMIFDEGVNAEAALYDVSDNYCRQLEAMEDEYIRARAVDIRDVRDQVLQALLGVVSTASSSLHVPSVVISRCLTPSDCISMDRRLVRGFCTMEGGTTSHVAILARSLGIPAVAGVDDEVLKIATGTTVILDGDAGTLIRDADEASLRAYELKRDARENSARKRRATRPILQSRSMGIVSRCWPTWEQQIGRPCNSAFRTEPRELGFSGPSSCISNARRCRMRSFNTKSTAPLRRRSVNSRSSCAPLISVATRNCRISNCLMSWYPFLGVRGLRLSLKQPAMFKMQLRAALRAGYLMNLRLMFPMVTKASEIRQARSILDEVKLELEADSVRFARDVEVGIMVEVPAAAILADKLADEVDFFSIGTNDLSQYTLAMDRTNTELSAQVDALDPAVLRLIAGVIEAAHSRGKKVGVCGELAGEPLAIPILLGFGLDEFSMNSPAIPIAKKVIRSISMTEAKQVAVRALESKFGQQVRELGGAAVP